MSESAGSTAPVTITLDSAAEPAGQDFIGATDGTQAPGANAPAPDGAAPAKDPAAPQTQADVDKMALELGRRSRGVSAKEKAVEQRAQQVTQQAQRYQKIDGVFALAKTDPVAFVTQLATAANLDLDVAINLLAKARDGKAAELPADERLARIERADQERREREEADRKAQHEREEAAKDEAAIAKVTGTLRQLAQGDGFPLIADDMEANVTAAFDLMILAYNAGKPISHINALHAIEKQLRDDTDRRAAKLGYQRNGATPNAPAPSPTTTPAQAPRISSNAAPYETAGIRSDAEIAADWLRGFGSMGA